MNQITSYKQRLHKLSVVFLIFLTNTLNVNANSLECKPIVRQGAVSLQKDIEFVAHSYQNALPDTPTMAYRIGSKTCIHITHYTAARICGTSLTNINESSEIIYDSPEDKVFSNFDYHNWLFSPYVLGDGSLIALAHSEWYDCLKYSEESPGYCKKPHTDNQINSWVNAITLYQSDDSGASWSRVGIVERPEGYPKNFEKYWLEGKMINFGFFHPSNIIREGNRYYAFVRYSERDSEGKQTKGGVILLSTSNPHSPNWEQVTPEGRYAYQPYRGNILPGTETWTQVSVTWNTVMCQYLILFWDAKQNRLMSTTTTNLAKPNFSTPIAVQNQENIQIPGNDQIGLFGFNYPVSQLDPDSLSNNFDTTDESFFVFMNSFTRKNVLDRNLFRVTAKLVPVERVLVK